MKKIILTLTIFLIMSSPVLGAAELHTWEDITGLEGGHGSTKVILIHGFQPGVFTDGLLRTIPVENWSNMGRAIIDNEKLAPEVELFVFLYQPYFDDISSIADKLKQEMDKLGIRDKETVFISHSMGGLVARHYTNYLEGFKTVKGIFTLGTPHMGIPLPFVSENLTVSPAVMDMQGTKCLLERYGFFGSNDGSYIQELNRVEKYADRYFTFSGRLDPDATRNFFSYVGEAYYQLISSLRVPGDGIVSNYSSRLEGANNFPPIEGVYHHDLYQNEIIISRVISGLEGILLGEEFPVMGKIIGEAGEALEGIRVQVGKEIMYSDNQGVFGTDKKFEFGTKIKPETKEGKSNFPIYQMVDGREGMYEFSQKETHSLGGTVRTIFSDNDPEGSILILSSVENDLDFFKTEIKEKGSFFIENVPSGTYRFLLYNINGQGLSFREFKVRENKLEMEINFFHLFNNNNNN